MSSNGTQYPPSRTWELYLFNEESRAGVYGIGTYLTQVIEAMRNSEWKVTVVILQSSKGATIQEEEIEGIRYIYIRFSHGVQSKHYRKRYYRNALQLLRPYISNLEEKTVFHLQQMHMADLALGLKTIYPLSKIVGTVHYMAWVFDLLGNKRKLKELLQQSESKEAEPYIGSIAEEKRFLNACDTVIAISQHSYESLQEVYGISKDRLRLIPNGLKDDYVPHTPSERKALRAKYGFKPMDKILIFAGRIDEMKGPDLLAEVLTRLVPDYPHLKLIVAGDGNYALLQSKLKPHWSKVTLTGFVDKTTLYELYSIADIGVLPSLHEEFGYVALEMMMTELALVVSKTTGLEEIVIDGETGVVVPFSKELERVNSLYNVIKNLLQSHPQQKRFGVEGRKRFINQYETNIFQFRIKDLYDNSIKWKEKK